jgi:hypothetical protein
MGILDLTLSYLGGAIDNAPDDGVNWRQDFISRAIDKNLKIIFLDPTDKSKLGGFTGEIKNEKELHQKLRAEGRWEELRNFMKPIVRADLRQTDLCDYLIAKITPKIFMCGTFDEISNVDKQKKPVLLIIEGGKKCCPSWLFGTIHYKYMFDNEEECIDYLCGIDRGDIPLDDRWVLMRQGIRTMQMEMLDRAHQKLREIPGKLLAKKK